MIPVAEANEKIKDYINNDKILQLKHGLFVSAIANFGCALVVYFSIDNNEYSNYYKWWLLAVIVISIIRILTAISFYNKRQFNNLFLRLFITGTIFSAALWGIMASVLMPYNTLDQMIVIIVIAGVTAGGIQTLNASLVASYSYLSLIIVPLAIWLYMQHQTNYLLLGFAISLYLIFMIVASRRGNHLLTSAIKLKYENKFLVDDLSFANEQLRETLQELKTNENRLIIINHMYDMLQMTQQSSEAYRIAAETAQRLLPNMNGALVIYDKDTSQLKTITQWGKNQIVTEKFSPNMCWSLRKDRIYFINDNTRVAICEHFTAPLFGSYFCVPLTHGSELIGLLHLNSDEKQLSRKAYEPIIFTFSEVIKLSLVNVNLHEALLAQAIRDPLTGLYNRRYMDDTLKREVQRSYRQGTNLCVAMLDLDFFKNFNDKYGHDAGDEILKAVGNLLQSEFREHDIACRFGGEEFLVILTNINAEAAYQRFENFRDKIKNMRLYYGKLLKPITISVGISTYPINGTTPEQLVTAADNALYIAKHNGRDRVEIQPLQTHSIL